MQASAEMSSDWFSDHTLGLAREGHLLLSKPRVPFRAKDMPARAKNSVSASRLWRTYAWADKPAFKHHEPWPPKRCTGKGAAQGAHAGSPPRVVCAADDQARNFVDLGAHRQGRALRVLGLAWNWRAVSSSRPSAMALYWPPRVLAR